MAIILIVFAAFTYFFVVRGLEKQTDNNLAEMAQNFRLSLKAEEADEDEISSAAKVISEVVGESLFRDYGFTIFAENGAIVDSTVKEENFNSAFLKTVINKKFSDFKTKDGKIYRVHIEPIELYGENFYLLVFYSLEDQIDFLENLKIVFFIAVPLTLTAFNLILPISSKT